MSNSVENLRKIAEEIRNTAQYLDIELQKTAEVTTVSDNAGSAEELDSTHVLNFLKFFGA